MVFCLCWACMLWAFCPRLALHAVGFLSALGPECIRLFVCVGPYMLWVFCLYRVLHAVMGEGGRGCCLHWTLYAVGFLSALGPACMGFFVCVGPCMLWGGGEFVCIGPCMLWLLICVGPCMYVFFLRWALHAVGFLSALGPVCCGSFVGAGPCMLWVASLSALDPACMGFLSALGPVCCEVAGSTSDCLG